MKVVSWWLSLPTWQKAASAGAVVGGLYLLFSGMGKRIGRYLVQNGPWGAMRLGNSPTVTDTIGAKGCLLTSVTMAANTLTGSDWDPPDVNDILRAGNGFSVGSPLMKLETAADLLHMSAPESERLHPGASIAQLRSAIDRALSRGGLAIVNVDKAPYTGTGEHFILVHAKTSKGYEGADPATGKDTFLDPTTLRGVAMWRSTPVNYQAVGVAPIFRGA